MTPFINFETGANITISQTTLSSTSGTDIHLFDHQPTFLSILLACQDPAYPHSITISDLTLTSISAPYDPSFKIAPSSTLPPLETSFSVVLSGIHIQNSTLAKNPVLSIDLGLGGSGKVELTGLDIQDSVLQGTLIEVKNVEEFVGDDIIVNNTELLSLVFLKNASVVSLSSIIFASTSTPSFQTFLLPETFFFVNSSLSLQISDFSMSNCTFSSGGILSTDQVQAEELKTLVWRGIQR